MVLIGAAYCGTLRARDGVNFDALAVLVGNTPFTVSVSPNACPMSFGPGATPDLPGSRLYWASFVADIQYTDGATVQAVPGSPVTASGFFFLYYDRLADVLYVTYQNGGATCTVASFDGAAWDTTYPNPGATGGTSSVISTIPPGSALRPNQPIIACDLASATQRVFSYDGAAWVSEVNQHISNIPMFLVQNGDEIVFGSWADRGVPTAADPLVQLRDQTGAWADITPAQWQPPTVNARRQAVCACVAEGDLYVAFYRVGGGKIEIWKRDQAGVWTLDLDIVAEGTNERPWSLSYIGGVIRAGMDDSSVKNYYLSKDVLGGGGWVRNPIAPGLQPALCGADSQIQFFLESPEGTIVPDHGNCSGEYVAPVVVYGFWDAQQFVAWDPATLWERNDGCWQVVVTPSVGTQVFIGSGVQQFVAPVGNGINGNNWMVGEIEILDPFVLTGRPSNGKGAVNVMVSNDLAPGHSLLGNANYPLFLPGGYTYDCPTIDSIDPAVGDIDGGYLVTLHGANFFTAQIPVDANIPDLRDVNMIRVYTAAGKFVTVDPRDVTFVDVNTLTFPMPSYPGGTDPAVEVRLYPAGLAPFTAGLPLPPSHGTGGLTPRYRCGRVAVDFTYTGLAFAILGSLDTVLGLGGTGGDVALPAGPPGLGGHPACPEAPAPGPCVR